MRPTLATERLRLEPLTEEHAELLAELDGDPAVLEHIFGRALTREESLAAFPMRLDPEADELGLGLWVGFEEARFVGWWCLLREAVPATAELGYRLPQDAWGDGRATEGALALLGHGFGTLGLGSVWAQTSVSNRASQRVLDKCGLRRVAPEAGCTGDPLPGWGRGELRYEISREEWRAQP
jgi:RimJ/RimL family protein N-acetyltransferase